MFGKAKSRRGYRHENTLKHSVVIENKKKLNNRRKNSQQVTAKSRKVTLRLGDTVPEAHGRKGGGWKGGFI